MDSEEPRPEKPNKPVKTRPQPMVPVRTETGEIKLVTRQRKHLYAKYDHQPIYPKPGGKGARRLGYYLIFVGLVFLSFPIFEILRPEKMEWFGPLGFVFMATLASLFFFGGFKQIRGPKRTGFPVTPVKNDKKPPEKESK